MLAAVKLRKRRKIAGKFGTIVVRPGEGEILIRISASGICGRDLREWYRDAEGQGLGHEVAGDTETGQGVTAFGGR